MRKITRLGLISTAGASAAALAVAGFALPASADTWNPSEETTTTVTEASTSIEGFQTWFRENVLGSGNDTTAGNLGIDGGLINGPLVSDSLNPAVLSGNDVSAPVGSGNDVSAPIDAPIGSGNDVSDTELGSVGDVANGTDVGGDTGVSVGDIGAEVDDLVGDVSGDVDSLVSGLLD
ncbi:hypothetical protein [Microbacterium lacus]|uniref:Uncharacterized protein n=1 Tax=Microbacterium lacus TaxID=415217 RepID=A0ABN2H9C1_9MICO